MSEEHYRKRLPTTRNGITHKFEIGGVEGYITTGQYDTGELGEIFIKIAKQGSTLSGLLDAWAITMSMAIQYGTPLEDIVSKLTFLMFEPSGITSNPEIRFTTSLIDYIGKWLAHRYLSPEKCEELGLSVVVEQVL